jgi:hypothetical protein
MIYAKQKLGIGRSLPPQLKGYWREVSSEERSCISRLERRIHVKHGHSSHQDLLPVQLALVIWFIGHNLGARI